MQAEFLSEELLNFDCRKVMSYGAKFHINNRPDKKGDTWIANAFFSDGEIEELFLNTGDVAPDYYVVIRGHKNGGAIFSYEAIPERQIINASEKIEAEIINLIEAAMRRK